MLKLPFLFLIFSSLAGAAMANPFRLCMASAISGTLVYEGEPLANTKIIREVSKPYRPSFKTYTFQTDEQGNFSVPVVYMYSFLGQFLPMQFVSHDLMSVVINGEKINFWNVARRKPEPNIESRGENLVIQCAVKNELEIVRVNEQMIFSNCSLNVATDPEEVWTEENIFDDSLNHKGSKDE